MTLLAFMNLFEEFRAASWDGWRAVLARLTPDAREFYAIVGRGAGKSRIVALLACFFASREYRRVPGEFVYIGVFAPDRKQAGVTFRYVVGLLKSVPPLAALIVAERGDSVELTNGVIIEVITASIAAPRGRAYALVIVEEAAFLPVDSSANPDVELLRAVRPALARVPGSLLAVVSSPYARRGVLWKAWRAYHDQPDGDVVLVQAPTLDLNPTFDRRAIENALEEDPASAGAEYLAQFRSDVEALVDRDVLEACVVLGRHELPYATTATGPIVYEAVVDPSGGSSDSFTLAIGHREPRAEQTVAVIDALRETKPPFSPASVVADYAALLKSYDVKTVHGDRYAGEFPRELFREHGLTYELLDKSKSDFYVDALALINSRRIELLDHARSLAQIAGLERRTARGGRDSVDHAPGGHDDLANVVCALAVRLASAAALNWRAIPGFTSAVTWDLVEPPAPPPPAPDRCAYCGGPAERCVALRESDSWWMSIHQQHPAVLEMRERQRQERIRRGHEIAGSDLGILRT
jgi:hypothetical protein